MIPVTPISAARNHTDLAKQNKGSSKAEQLSKSRRKLFPTVIFQRPPHCVASLSPSEGHLDLEELLRSGRRHDCVDVEANDPLYVLHTSGTTGRELGVTGY